MFPESGGGGLGSAKGSIQIDVTSVLEAVQATKRAAQDISANLSRINQAAQSRVNVDAQRVTKDAQAQVDAAKLAADIRSKSAAGAAASIVASLQREQQAHKETAKTASAEAKKLAEERIREAQQQSALIRDAAQKEAQEVARLRAESDRNERQAIAELERRRQQVVQQRIREAKQAALIQKQINAEEAAAQSRVRKNVEYNTAGVEREQNKLLQEQLKTEQAISAENARQVEYQQALNKALAGEAASVAKVQQAAAAQTAKMVAANTAAVEKEQQRLLQAQLDLEKAITAENKNQWQYQQMLNAALARDAGPRANTPPLTGRAQSLSNLAGLRETGFADRMPTFAQFQLYPLMQLFTVIGATDAANIAALSMGILGFGDVVKTFVPTIVELGRSFGQSKNLIGDYTRAVVGMIPGLSATAASFVAVTAVLAPIAAVAIAVAGAIKVMADAAERGRAAAEETAKAIDRETQQRQSLIQTLGQFNAGDLRRTESELMAQAAVAQTGVTDYQTRITGLEGQLGIPAGYRGDILRAGFIPAIAELKAELDATYESMEQASDGLTEISDELLLLRSAGSQATAILDRINQPLRDMALRREMTGMDSGSLSTRITQDQAELALNQQKINDLAVEYSAALATNNTVLASVLLVQNAVTQARIDELNEGLRIARATLPLTQARERIQQAVAATVQGIRDFTEQLRTLQKQQSEGQLNRDQTTAQLMRSGDPAQIREMIAARQDEAVAIRNQLPALAAQALYSADARAQLVAFVQRLGQIGLDIRAFAGALPVAETRQKLQQLRDVLEEYFPNLFPPTAIEQLRNNLEQARTAFRDFMDNAIRDIEDRIQSDTAFAGARRTANVEGVASSIQNLQDERSAIQSSLPGLTLRGLFDESARKKAKEYRDRLTEINNEIGRWVGEVLPAAFARAQGELISQINEIERSRDAAIQSIKDDLARREREIEDARQEALDEARDDAEDDRKEVARKNGEALAKIEDDLAKAREKILRRFARDSQTAIANRDALAYYEAQQQRDEDLADLREQGEERKQELDKQYKEQNAAIDKRLAEQQATIKKRYDDQLRTARSAADRQIQLERDRATAEISARRDNYVRQFNDLTKALYDEYALRYSASRATVGLAEWTAREVNRILASVTGRQIAIPQTVQLPPTTSQQQAYNQYAAYQRSQGIPGFAVGTNYVPSDSIYRLHEGEGVMNPGTNDIVRRMLGTNYTQPQLAAAVMRGTSGGSTASGASSNANIFIQLDGRVIRAVSADEAGRVVSTAIKELFGG